MTATLTICIPAYNQPEFLRDALRSLCDQGLARDAYVVAVSDDASPTSLAGVVDEFRDQLQIEFTRQDRNIGHLQNFAYVASMVRTPFLTFLPHDDVIAPGHLSRALAAIEREPGTAMVASLVLSLRHPGAYDLQPHGFFPDGRTRARFGELYRWTTAEWMALALVATPMSMVGSVVRTETLAQCRRWLSFPLWHDRLMLAEIGLHGEIVTVPWIGGHYRISPQQLSAQLWQRHSEEFVNASLTVLAWCHEAGIEVEGFWIDRICAADRTDRVAYLQLLSAALPHERYIAIKGECEARLGERLHIGRLQGLGLPSGVAAVARRFYLFLGRRLG